MDPEIKVSVVKFLDLKEFKAKIDNPYSVKVFESGDLIMDLDRPQIDKVIRLLSNAAEEMDKMKEERKK